MKSSQGKWTNSDKVAALCNKPAPGRPRTGSPRLQRLAEWVTLLRSGVQSVTNMTSRSFRGDGLFQNSNSFLKSLAVKYGLLALKEIFQPNRADIIRQSVVQHNEELHLTSCYYVTIY